MRCPPLRRPAPPTPISLSILVYGALDPEGRWLALVAGAAWLPAHGLFHVAEPVNDTVSLFLSAIAKLAPGESAYVHALAHAPGHALEKFMNFMPATAHRHTASSDIFHLARIGATRREDCGPCVLTAAQGALADGVARELINVALRDGSLLTGDQLTAFQFGQALAGHSPDAFALGDEIEQQYRHVGGLELAMTAARVRGYPALKRGLGPQQSLRFDGVTDLNTVRTEL